MRTGYLMTLALLTLSNLNSYAQPEFQFGLTANPILTWLKPEASEIDKGMRGGLEYGLLADINVTDNYILSTGITHTLCGGKLTYTDSLLLTLTGDSIFSGSTDTKFKLQYVNIPLIFKMRTKEIGKLKYYGGLGLVPSFRFKARVDAEANGTQIFENDNIVKRKDQTGVFQSTVFNVSLHVEGGVEFPFSAKTALVAGIFYRNGFMNVLKDGDEDRISLNHLGLRVAVLF